MSSNIFKINATGAAAIAATATVPAGVHYALVSVTCKFSAAPTTSENLTVTLDANAGAAYDVVIYTLNPSTGSTTSVLYQPTYPLVFEPGDKITVAFANTDTRTYGVQITLQAV
jgi:hypothetical protein